MGFNKLSLRTKLIGLFLVLGLTPMIVSNWISFVDSKAAIEKLAGNQAEAASSHKVSDLENYFQGLSENLHDLAQSPTTAEALTKFASTFPGPKVPEDSDLGKIHRAEMRKYYSTVFAPEYESKSGRKVDIENFLSKMDNQTTSAQYDFIAKNENPLGKKDQMLKPARLSPYVDFHVRFHPIFQEFVNYHALYDVFLVSAEGRIVYTYFKEADFGTSLKDGPWADSGLGHAFEATKSLKNGDVHLEDFAIYTPSYDAPASFASTPIYSEGKYVGALIVQIPLDKITSIAAERVGLGKNGDVILLGSDGKLRADTYRQKDKFSVKNSFTPDSKLKLDTEPVKKALAGESGVYVGESYDGLETVAFYSTIKIGNLKWYIVSELSKDEVEEDLIKLRNKLALIMGIGILLIGLSAYLFGRMLSGQLGLISENLNKSSREVSSSSAQSASSATELSEAATEQAASLQETMASVEEISAMVSQNAESALKAKSAVDANQEASEQGAQSVLQMLHSISEIKETNDQILTQMENSNKEFGEIVRIISDIGEKTNVINDIVFQTKLLSFNASVEAARAGEHGKGFAVVAEEVGNLAQMSGNAAREITEMLSDSIKRVNGIVEQTKEKVDELVEVGRDKISSGQATAQRCKEVLDKITANAKAMSSMITEITHASKEQAQGIQEINKAISQLDQVTQQNSAVAQQSSSKAESLSAEASGLERSVRDLVQLIEGAKGKIDSAASSVEAVAVKAPKKKVVVPMTKVAATPVAHKSKKAAGSDITPDSNDPGFEEF